VAGTIQFAALIRWRSKKRVPVKAIRMSVKALNIPWVQLKVGVKAEPCRGSFLLAIDDGADKSLKIK
jgi:hypothetical protein